MNCLSRNVQRYEMFVVLWCGLRSTTWAVCVAPFGPPLCTTTMTGSAWSDCDCKISWTAFKLRCVLLSPPGWNNVSSGSLLSVVTGAPVTNMRVVGAHEHLSACVCCPFPSAVTWGSLTVTYGQFSDGGQLWLTQRPSTTPSSPIGVG